MSNKVIKKIRIRCSGHLHEIGLNQKGQLIFFNHTKAELKAEQALCELGAEPCGCLKFLEKWRKKQFYKKEFENEAEEIRNKRTKRLINNSIKQQIKITDLQQIKAIGFIKEYQKLYITRQKDLSVKLIKRTLKKQNAQIINIHEYAGYDYLGYNFHIDLDVTFTYLNNTFSILFHHDWWKIYKNFKGGIIDNKIITHIENHSTSYIVSAINLLVKHKIYKIEINKDNQKWKIIKEELT